MLREAMRRIGAPALALIALVLLTLTALTAPRWASAVNLSVFDGFQRMAPRIYDPQAPVRIVDIDSEALAETGQWPWPRSAMALMVERLTALGAAAIAFDVLFAEPDRTAPDQIARTWARFSPDVDQPDLTAFPDHDALFAAALAASPGVLGVILTAEGNGVPDIKASLSALGPDPTPHLPRFGGAEINLPGLEDAARGVGSITLSERRGGVVRTAPLLSMVGDRVVPALSIEALRVALGAPGFLARSAGGGGEVDLAGTGGLTGLRIGPMAVPTRADGAIWVRYSGPDPRRTLSATAILGEDWDSEAMTDAIEGRIVFVGASAPGLRDLVATPLSDSELGVAVHAEIVEQIAAQDFLNRPDWAPGLEIAAMAGLGLTVCLALMLAPPLAVFALVLAGLAVAGFGSWWAFEARALLIGPLWPVLGAAVPWAVGSLVNYIRAESDRRTVRAQFAHFLAPEIVEEIARDPARYLRPGGEDRELTILFCDIRRFSTLSAGMSPDAVIAFLNDFLTPVSDAIVAHGGAIDKYIGDAVMAFWNAPKERTDHREQAMAAALAIREAVSALNARFEAEGRPVLAVGIGLNTGLCSVGSIGSRRRLDYTCIGDAVNVASRLEGLTRAYGVDLCVADSVVSGGPEFAAIELDLVTVVGRDDHPERVYALLGAKQEAGFDTVRALAGEALAAYRAVEIAPARQAFTALAQAEPALADYAAIMIARLDRFETDPPPAGWNGVHRSTSK